MLPPNRNQVEKPAPVKILVLSANEPEGIVSSNNLSDFLEKQPPDMKARLDAVIKSLNQKNKVFQIEFINEMKDEKSTAEKIASKHCQVVLVNNNISQSPWHIIDHCTEQSDQKPIFYLDGKAEDICDKAIRKTEFSGVVQVNKDNQPLIAKAYGAANQSPKQTTPNQLGTKFVIASITKMFTAVSIAKLVEQDQLKFDDPVTKFLPDTFPHKNFFVDHKITIRELLTHSSGLAPFEADCMLHRSATLDFRSVSDFLLPMMKSKEFEKEILTTETRGEYNYSNTNYLLLGYIIEQCSGESYYQYVQEHVLSECKMQNTTELPTYGPSCSLIHGSKLAEFEIPNSLREGMQPEEKPALVLIENYANFIRDLNQLVSSFQDQMATVKNDSDYATLKQDYQKKIAIEFELFDSLRKGIETLLPKDEKSNLTPLEKILSDFADNLKQPYGRVPSLLVTFIFNLSIATPAGCFRATADDLMRFQRALWEGRILKNPDTLLRDKVGYYSYGVCTWPDESVGHAGLLPGVVALLRHYPQMSIDVVTLANSEADANFPRDLIDKYLIPSCQPGSQIHYFDPQLNPSAVDALLKQLDVIAPNAAKTESTSSASICAQLGITPDSIKPAVETHELAPEDPKEQKKEIDASLTLDGKATQPNIKPGAR